ncbi:uncharacterized protein LOC119606281 [Lucilia sericata]|uniref:uncharacterized protein LOC119606281 n=1 Tax=Lucilia sericata TaxID=13632 RepID=UPI0018A82E0B|nr:uncharacterized protein LOC119606281 [Lucilia sericata]
MSNINICLSLLIIYLTLQKVKAKPAEEISYLEKIINFQYENDQWICGDIKCPENTFGCKIRLRSDEKNKKVFYQSFSCFDEDKMNTYAAGDIIEMAKEKEIDIELESYKGAESVYMLGYGMGGNESAKGVVAVEDLSELKESAKINRKAVGNPPA